MRDDGRGSDGLFRELNFKRAARSCSLIEFKRVLIEGRIDCNRSLSRLVSSVSGKRWMSDCRYGDLSVRRTWVLLDLPIADPPTHRTPLFITPDLPFGLDTCCQLSSGNLPCLFPAALYEFVHSTNKKEKDRGRELGDFERRLIFRSSGSHYLELAAGQLLLIRCPRPASSSN